MKCPSCAKEIPETAKVCGYCGTRMPAHSPPKDRPVTPAQKGEPVVSTPIPKPPPETTSRPEAQPVKPAPTVRPTVPKPRASGRGKLPVWTWGGIGALVILAALYVLASTGAVFIPYISRPPEPVSEVLLGARVVYHNDFSGLPESFFEYDDHNVILTNGVAEISGNDYDYPYIMYAPTNNLREGDAVLVTFRYDTGSWLSLSFLSGEYATPQHRQWGVNEGLEVYTVRQEEWSAYDQLQGNLNLQPNKWYTLLMAISDGPQFLAHIWERDNPGQSAQFRQSFSGDKWEDRGWVFWIANTKGKLYIDEISKMTFNGLK